MAIPNRGPQLLGANIAFVVTAFLTLGLRCFVRLRMVKAFGRDDALMLFASVSICKFLTTNKVLIRFSSFI